MYVVSHVRPSASRSGHSDTQSALLNAAASIAQSLEGGGEVEGGGGDGDVEGGGDGDTHSVCLHNESPREK